MYYEAFGFRDKAAGAPMTNDTIFNIASMTKPMAAVAALQLYEQGKLLIDDPLSKYFPKFAEHAGRGARRQGRDHHRHGAGRAPDHDAGSDAAHLRPDLWRARQHRRCTSCIRPAAASRARHDGAEFMDKLADAAAAAQPGAVWDYGFGLDVLGLVVEKIAGRRSGNICRTTSSSRSA